MSDQHAVFRVAVGTLDGMVGFATKGACSLEGEPTLRPDGFLEVWDCFLEEKYRETVRKFLQISGANVLWRTRLDRKMWIYEIPPSLINWIETTARATGMRMRPSDYA